MSEDTFDAIVIGAGENGLVLGNYLGKAGLNVVVANVAWNLVEDFPRRSLPFRVAGTTPVPTITIRCRSLQSMRIWVYPL